MVLVVSFCCIYSTLKYDLSITGPSASATPSSCDSVSLVTMDVQIPDWTSEHGVTS